MAVGHFVLDVGSATGLMAFPARAGDRAEARRLAAALSRPAPVPLSAASATDVAEDAVASAEEVTSCLEHVAQLFNTISDGHALDPAYLDGQLDAALGILRQLDHSGRFEEAFRVAKAVSGVLTLARRWGKLLESLQFAERAARELGDPVGQAFVRHQLGTLALGADDAARADRLLSQSLSEREGLADASGAATTRHNLELIGQRSRRLPRIGLPVPVLVAAGLLALIIAGPDGRPPGDATVSVLPWSSIVPVMKAFPDPVAGKPGRLGPTGPRGRSGRDQTPGGDATTVNISAVFDSRPATTDEQTRQSLHNVEPPTIIGTPVVGDTLTATNGKWAGADVASYQYRWVHCDAIGADCHGLAGVARPTLQLTSGLAGRRVYLRVKAIARDGRYDKERSDLTEAVLSPPRNVELPTIAGTPFVGRRLTATPGTWTGAGITGYRFEWWRCDAGEACAPIPGANESEYRLTAADAEQTVRVSVTATNSLGSLPARSRATDRIDDCDRVAIGVSDAIEPVIALPARLRVAHCTIARARLGQTAIDIPIGAPSG